MELSKNMLAQARAATATPVIRVEHSAMEDFTSAPQSLLPVDSDRAPWFVYLLECADGTLYCGITTDLERRLAQHNGLRAGGARYTRSRRPVKLRVCRACPDHAAAARMEALVQSLPRRKKLAAFA